MEDYGGLLVFMKIVPVPRQRILHLAANDLLEFSKVLLNAFVVQFSLSTSKLLDEEASSKKTVFKLFSSRGCPFGSGSRPLKRYLFGDGKATLQKVVSSKG